MPTLPIVGARFRPPAQEVLDSLPAGAKLLLRRQPDNPYDRNAVQVLWPNTENIEVGRWFGYGEANETGIATVNAELPLHLGFIPREVAAKLAPVMDTWLEREWEDDCSDDTVAEWPATLTFSTSGEPCVSFEAPQEYDEGPMKEDR